MYKITKILTNRTAMIKKGVIEDIIDNFCIKPYNAKYILNEILVLFNKYIKHPKKLIIN